MIVFIIKLELLRTQSHCRRLFQNKYAVHKLQYNPLNLPKTKLNKGNVVEWLKRRARGQHGLGSKPTRAILLCPWERQFTTHSPAWWSWQAVLNYSHISITSGQQYLGISGNRSG